jgi:hypothetical protein
MPPSFTAGGTALEGGGRERGGRRERAGGVTIAVVVARGWR